MARASDVENLLDELATPRHVALTVRGGADAGARSYLADGRQVTWAPPLPDGVIAAVDAELAAQPVPPALARRFGVAAPAQFWPLWTAVEVCCKLLDASLLAWLSERGLHPDEQVPRRTFEVDGVVVCCGLLAADDPRRLTRRRRRRA